MNRLSVATLSIFVAILVATAIPQNVPTETISGTIVAANTNQALSHARVELVREDYARRPTGFEKTCKPQPDTEVTTFRRFVSTDQAGRFTFDNIVPGRYYLIADREGYLKTEYGQRGLFPLGTVLTIGPQPEQVPTSPEGPQRELGLLAPLIETPEPRPAPPPRGLSAGAASAIREGTLEQTGIRGGLGRDASGLSAGANSAISDGAGGTPRNLLQNLGISLTPAPTITGKVMQEDGVPLAAATVQAYAFRYTPMNGRTLKSVRAALTNDGGAYRLFWLDPGRYVVAAGHSIYGLQPWTSGLKFTPNLPSSDSGYPILFHAVALRAADAQIVPLNPGSEPLVDLRLRNRRRLTVRIRLVGEQLSPAPALVFVPAGGDLCAALDYAISGKDGRFEVGDVPEGLYVAAAISGRDFVSNLISVKVEGEQPDETLLPVVPPTQIWGSVHLSGVLPGTDIAKAMRVHLTRTSQSLSHVATGALEPASPTTGRFSIPGLGPGSYYISMDLPPGFYIENVGASQPDLNKPDECSMDPTLWSPRYSYMDGHGHLNPTQPFLIPEVIPGSAACLAIKVRFGQPIYGFVYNRLRTPVAGALVVAIPKSVWFKTDDAGVTPPDRFLTATTDSTGYFELHGATESAYPVKDQASMVPQEYHLYAFENIDPNLIYAPDFSMRFQARESFVVRREGRPSGVASGWQPGRSQQAVIAYASSCPGMQSPIARQYCILTSIPAEETAEIR